MLKQEAHESITESAPVAQQLWAFFRGQLVPLRDANVSVMTHAFNYGTAVFEGIRAYWNAEQEQLYALDLIPHFTRLRKSASLLFMDVPYSAEELAETTLDLLRRDGLREDVYIRPLIYKSSEVIGVRLHNLDADTTIFAVPFGHYIDIEDGIRAQTSSWRRNDDNALPARGKVTGGYVNSALSKTEAQLNGYDEAIVLTHDGHVSEGSAENLFVVRDGRLLTPPVTDNILEGITRRAIMDLAADELSVECVERSIDRTELYAADEVFLTGTGYQIAPVVEVDGRPVGAGEMGPVAGRLQEMYFEAARGDNPEYGHWTVAVEVAERAAG